MTSAFAPWNFAATTKIIGKMKNTLEGRAVGILVHDGSDAGAVRSLRKAAFGYSMDDTGAMRFRQLLPDGYDRFGWAAADGQMGQILHAYLDWKLTGDDAWLREMWPRLKRPATDQAPAPAAVA